MLTNIKKGFSVFCGVVFKNTPLYVQVVITNKCNLFCRMCSASISRKDDEEMDMHRIEELARTLNRLNTAVVVLTGGEPMLREDLNEIVEIFSRENILVRLQTNGTLLSRNRLESLVKAGLKGITVSLDSLSPSVQEEINKKEGSWHKTIESLSLISDIMPLSSIIGVNTVVSRYNITEVEDIVKLANVLGFYSSIIPIHVRNPENSSFIVRAGDQNLKFTEKDYNEIDALFATLICMKRSGFLIHNSYRFLKEAPDFIKNSKIKWRCLSPGVYFAVSSSGNFLPCIDVKFDNIPVNRDFIKRYYSKDFRTSVKNYIKECSGCMYPCWSEVSYICDDFSSLFERALVFISSRKNKRPKYTHGNILEIIDEIKRSKSSDI